MEIAYSIGDLEDEPSSFVVKKATMQASDAGIVEANAEVTDLLLTQNESGSWIRNSMGCKRTISI